LAIALVFAGLASCIPSQAQVAAYGEFTADYLNGGPNTNFLYGGSAGILLDGPKAFNKILLSAAIQGNFAYSGATSPKAPFSTGEAYDAATIGPRATFAPFLKLAPYIQFNVGFARYHDNFTHSTTDYVFGGQAGVTRRLTPHLDAVLDYSYSEFGYNSGVYSPQSFSVGALYHFAIR
jgi:opacity protein-like surface antigen